MERKNIYFSPEIWVKAMTKASKQKRSLAVILRLLLEMWVNDEIDLKM